MRFPIFMVTLLIWSQSALMYAVDQYAVPLANNSTGYFGNFGISTGQTFGISIPNVVLLQFDQTTKAASFPSGSVRAINQSLWGASYTALPFPGQTTTGEGGQIDLVGVGANPTISIDNIANTFRIYSGGTVWMSANSTGLFAPALTLTNAAVLGGPVIIGTDPGGAETLRVSGSAKVKGPISASGT